MNRLFPTLLALGLSLQGSAQTRYDVTFHTQTDAPTLYLLDAESHQVLDSARVLNHQVNFRGQVPAPLVAAISDRPQPRKQMTALLLDGQPLTLRRNDTGMLEGTGSKENLCMVDFANRSLKNQEALQTLAEEYRKAATTYAQQVPDTLLARFQARYESLRDSSQQATKAMLEANRENLLPLFTLLYASDMLGYDYVERYLDTYRYKDRASLLPLKEIITKEKRKLPGAHVADISLPNLEGKLVNLTDYVGKGKYVLVDFWASWCGPCRREMPNVVAAYQQYHAKGFEVVGISLDNKREAWAQAVSDLQMPWPQMSDLKGWKSEAAALYNIRSIPATILYGPDGKVLATNLHGQGLKARLAAIFGE